jgi:hypothetical protein
MGPLSSAMTSADSLSLIPRRLDEIERKLDRMMEELRTTPTAIGYSVPPMPDAVSRLQLAHDEINKTFGVGFAEKHPEV